MQSTDSTLLLLLLLSRLSRVCLCATPQMAAHQAPPSLGFSRQEHWSGLPFPSPMHESEKWKRSRSVVPDSQRPHGLQPTRLHHPWDFPGKSTGVGCHCLLRQIQCNPYQITNGIFQRTRTKNFTIQMETQKTQNSQSSLEKEEWSWRNQPSDYNTKLQSSKQYGTGTKTEI